MCPAFAGCVSQFPGIRTTLRIKCSGSRIKMHLPHSLTFSLTDFHTFTKILSAFTFTLARLAWGFRAKCITSENKYTRNDIRVRTSRPELQRVQSRAADSQRGEALRPALILHLPPVSDQPRDSELSQIRTLPCFRCACCVDRKKYSFSVTNSKDFFIFIPLWWGKWKEKNFVGQSSVRPSTTF